MKSPEIVGQRILLLGYGREGQSTHRFLLANYSEISVSIADKNPIQPIAAVPNQYLGAGYLLHLTDFDTVIRSPGVPAHLPELEAYRKKGGSVTSATNIFFSLCKGKTIGVTGTKGKSTTSALISQILSTQYPDVRLVGNIGNPMLDALNRATTETIFVIELSGHQLEDIRYSPHVAVVLNVFPEHLDYYQSFDQYVAAKANIVAFQTKNDAVVYDDANETAGAIAQKGRGQKIPISLYKKTPIPKTMLLGNDDNIRTAIAVASLFRVPKKNILKSLTRFQPLPHRLEFVGEFKGIRFYNDSLATIPEATIHALEALGPEVTTLIAGGFDRGLDYTKLGEFLAKREGLKTLVLFPDTGKNIWEAVKSAGSMTHQKKYNVSTMEEAVQLAVKYTPKGKICLLSPAAASFNLFRDYAERGDLFKKLVAAQ